MKIKTKKKLNSLNLLCAIILGLYGIYYSFLSLKALGNVVADPVSFVAYLGFAAFLDLCCYGYFKNKKKFFVIGAVCEIVALIILNIANLSYYKLWFIIVTTSLEIAYLVLLIIVVKKKNNQFKFAVIAAICTIVDWVSFNGTPGFQAVIMIAVAILIGITFSNCEINRETIDFDNSEVDNELIDFESIKRSIDSYKKKKRKISVSKAADDIKSLKEMLDDGTITKKEFTEKKEEIFKKM